MAGVAALLATANTTIAEAQDNCVANVTANTTLSANSSCEYHVAPGVTLNLNGWTVGAVVFGDLPGTAVATVSNGTIDPSVLATTPVASVLSLGSPIAVNQVTITSGGITGTATSSTITQNTLEAGAITLNGGTHNVYGNVLTGGGVDLINSSGVIDGNILHGNNGAGVGMTVTGNVRVTNNSISGHYIGVSARIGPNGMTISGNVIAFNDYAGVVIEHVLGSNSRVSSNLVAFNGISVPPGTAGSGDGIYVNAILGAGVTPVAITGNTVWGNAWYGIEAISGYSDGGGNRAHSNEGPTQCWGVKCSKLLSEQTPTI